MVRLRRQEDGDSQETNAADRGSRGPRAAALILLHQIGPVEVVLAEGVLLRVLLAPLHPADGDGGGDWLSGRSGDPPAAVYHLPPADELRQRLRGSARRDGRPRSDRAVLDALLGPPSAGVLPEGAEPIVLWAVHAVEGLPFDEPPVAPPDGTPYQRRVWSALRHVSLGETTTYGRLADAAGGSPQSVGQALRANPLHLYVPCHRVVAAGGGIGGFTPGLAWKNYLLWREGATLPPREPPPARTPRTGR